jgi:V-type H+-transporting ATPase 16kDa proteolipid subunit
MSTPELLTGLGAAAAMFLCSAGACIASVPAGIFALHGECSFKSFGPIVIAGVLAIYGFIVAIILVPKLTNDDAISMKDGYKALSAGIIVGLSCLASGCGMSRFIEQSMGMLPLNHRIAPESAPLLSTPRPLHVKAEFSLRFFLCMVYLEAIGLYGLIVALLLTM